MTAGTPDKIDMDLYLTKDTVYMLNPSTKKWEKSSAVGTDPLGDLSSLMEINSAGPQAEANMIAILPYTSYSEDNMAYHIAYTIDSNGLKKLLELQKTNPMAPQLQNGMTMKMTLDIDKATYLQQGMSMQMEADQFGTHLITQMTATVKDFDKMPQVTVPDDVLKNAVETTH
ncbi:hypothetical protein EL26_16285 [Tumebacillus flagellatus]|uniref:Uncharacterized protein n=2 Tax=Tumebacillus flagellatus TaxID=1157490 RepID=A0A074LJI2_9BACL|nr:DUF6612 family protein [Tumebacillus flagellatus]KEO82336.1 hypothetical protein EL26_16285 [Tumebacillus flagellatus]